MMLLTDHSIATYAHGTDKPASRTGSQRHESIHAPQEEMRLYTVARARLCWFPGRPRAAGPLIMMLLTDHSIATYEHGTDN